MFGCTGSIFIYNIFFFFGFPKEKSIIGTFMWDFFLKKYVQQRSVCKIKIYLFTQSDRNWNVDNTRANYMHNFISILIPARIRAQYFRNQIPIYENISYIFLITFLLLFGRTKEVVIAHIVSVVICSMFPINFNGNQTNTCRTNLFYLLRNTFNAAFY